MSHLSHRYDLIDGGSNSTTRKRDRYKSLGGVALLICVLIAAFFAGRYSMMPKEKRTTQGIRLDMASRVFKYNRTFAEPPSAISNDAWESLFPTHGGFFIHPELAPKRSAFSVFHQLHCLNGLRMGFWALYNNPHKRSETSLCHIEHGTGDMPDLPHIRHCIDLLRQSLMCQPDLTIEVKNEELGGVTGFDTEHQCKNWEQLQRWTAQWEDSVE